MNDYPTEEELNRMIEELEREQLYAPKHLKEDILFKARKIEKRTVIILSQNGKYGISKREEKGL